MSVIENNIPKPKRFSNWLLAGVIIAAGLMLVGVFALLFIGQACYAQNNALQNQSPLNSTTQEIIVYQNGTNISELYAKVKSSVVTIQGLVASSSGIGQVQGSGFLNNQTGQITIITNFHVVNSARNITITFDDGKAYPAKVVGSDAYSDLAILQFDGKQPTKYPDPLKMISSSLLKVGDPVIAVGNPFGLTGSLTEGIISQVGRTLSEDTAGSYLIANALQIDVPINPGNSGGPLLDFAGNVVGITTAVVSDSQGLGLAIPSDTILRELPSLIANGSYSKHAWLGISSTDMSYYLSEAIGENYTYGVLIAETTQNGPARAAGLIGGTTQVQIAGQNYLIGGDIILALNGTTILNGDGLSSYLNAKTLPEDIVIVLLVRNRKVFEMSVTLGTRPPPPT